MAVVYGVTFLVLATVPCGVGFVAGYAAGRESVTTSDVRNTMR